MLQRGVGLDYRASVAQWKAEMVAQRPKTAKLVVNHHLREYVQERLSGDIRYPDGNAAAGPTAGPWKVRNKPHRGDRGWVTAWSPDTSTDMAEYAAAHGLACSVGRAGVCWDNAQQESYWASLKVEFYNRRHWPTRAEAMTAVGDRIERVYNRRRRHSALNMLSPVRFEQLHRQMAEAA